MSVEIGIWRIDKSLEKLEFSSLALESRLEDLLEQDISIASPNWMVIGRQVRTSFDKYIDLLAMDADGNLVVLELKRDKTYRDIISQVLDYGSWIKSLQSEDIAHIYQEYLAKYHPDRANESINAAFSRRFNSTEMPEELNEAHELVIVSSALDPSTERIVAYLAAQYGVRINAVFFRVFRDRDREYLSRAWLNETSCADPGGDGEWNGEYYASFSRDRSWGDAVKYGYFSAGGGSWYTNTLQLLEPGSRIWVNMPGVGYVGVGEVLEHAVPVDEFMVKDPLGKQVPITTMPLEYENLLKYIGDQDKIEQLVRVKWLKTVPVDQAIKEKGFFGNQNSVARPTAKKWVHTIERLKKRFGIE